MKKTLPLLLLIGAGWALVSGLKRKQRAAKAQRWGQRSPRTALVTGASSGIGAAFARALAQQGYNLVILARREDRLRAIAQELQNKYPVQVDLLVGDLDSPADLERIERQISTMEDLDLLVNNAGFGTAEEFARMEGEEAQAMVRVMVLASMRLARAALPGMIQRGHGGIINVSSLAGFMPFRGNSVYGATKAYLNFFSESLAEELAGTGVRVQALCPGFTYTEIHNKSGRPKLPVFLWLEPEEVVAESLQGLREGRLYVIPGAVYKAGMALFNNPVTQPITRLAQSLLVRRLVLPDLAAPGPAGEHGPV